MLEVAPKFYFLYKTTCVSTGQFYIGKHITCNLEDGYLGSGRDLLPLVNRFGRENFIVEILEFLSDRKSLAIREREVVTLDLLQNPLCLNRCIGGEGGPIRMKPHSEETKRMIGQKAKERAALHGGTWKGKQHSPDTKKLMSDKKKGKTYEEIFGPEKAEQMRKKRAEETKSRPPTTKGRKRIYLSDGGYILR